MRKGKLKQKIEEARKIHGDFYDYSLVIQNEPKSVRYKTQIICPIHGIFEMSLDNHVSKKQKCPKCSGVAKKTTDEFVEICKEVHKDKNYDFSEVDYKNCHTKVKVICHEKDILGREHGEFWIRADHLKSGHGCPKCAHRYLTNEEWIAMAERVHGKGRYDYSLINYTNKQKEKGKFICHRKDENGIEHGIFEQMYGSHLMGVGCPKCNGGVKHDGETFVRNARKIHGDKYIYYPDEYINAQTKIRITCKIHGDFYQTPTAHLRGEGCPYCKNSILEDRIQRMLEDVNLYFEKNVYIGLGKQTIDFYIPQKRLYIECQGEQHYVPTKFQPSMTDKEAEENLIKRKKLDEDKFNQIVKKNKELVYYTDPRTFHNKDADIIGEWYKDKLVFKTVNDVKDFCLNKPNYEYIAKNNFFKKRNSVTKKEKWDYVNCEKEAKKYTKKYEMKINNQSAYNASVKNGWINIFFPNSQSNVDWNDLNNILEAAKQCKGAKDMIKKFGGAYNSARKHGWLDKLEYCNKD